MVVWSWWDWSLIWTTIFILQCCHTVGWVIWHLLLTANKLSMKTILEMTYNVSSWTLSSSLLYCGLQNLLVTAHQLSTVLTGWHRIYRECPRTWAKTTIYISRTLCAINCALTVDCNPVKFDGQYIIMVSQSSEQRELCVWYMCCHLWNEIKNYTIACLLLQFAMRDRVAFAEGSRMEKLFHFHLQTCNIVVIRVPCILFIIIIIVTIITVKYLFLLLL